ncbi:hypothetical protein [Blastomonas sp. AAP53]|uniref:hypothetical protein n=1 Tax=Blastomonas sp. AAP53 TaxID=1248760 RepID=UPI00031882BE|nr:hypothetical protein [Blastomonas sp. AAP53]
MIATAEPRSGRSGRRFILAFAAVSLIAVVSGAVTMANIGIPALRWALNLAAWAVGALLALAIVRARPRGKGWTFIALGGAAAILATLVGPDQLGIHRWLTIGPLFIHGAAIMLPAVIVALARMGHGNRVAQAIALVVAAVLTVQPDASQAWGFALASLAWLWPGKAPSALAQGFVMIALAAIATLSPDPLGPVPEVEQIIMLALTVHPALAAVAVTALAALPLVVWRSRPCDRAALSLALYSTAIVLAPAFGWFPVPLVGSGMSFVLGLWLGAALLAAPHFDAPATLPLELPTR